MALADSLTIDEIKPVEMIGEQMVEVYLREYKESGSYRVVPVFKLSEVSTEAELIAGLKAWKVNQDECDRLNAEAAAASPKPPLEVPPELKAMEGQNILEVIPMPMMASLGYEVESHTPVSSPSISPNVVWPCIGLVVALILAYPVALKLMKGKRK